MSIESLMSSNHLILSSPSPPAFYLSQHQGLFKRVSSLHQVAKGLEFQFQRQSFQRIFRTDYSRGLIIHGTREGGQSQLSLNASLHPAETLGWALDRGIVTKKKKGK